MSVTSQLDEASGGTKYERIAIEVRQSLARVELSNPPLNVIDLQMMDELLAVLEAIEQQSEVIAIVICGAGKAFSAGVDIAAHTPDKVTGMLAKFHSVIRARYKPDHKPARSLRRRRGMLRGPAEIALVCDLVYTA